MCASPQEKLGPFVPAALHERLVAAKRTTPRCALQTAYALALADLLEALDGGEEVIFAAVRGPKPRVAVRLREGLSRRLRGRLKALNLKITDFACAASDRYLAQA